MDTRHPPSATSLFEGGVRHKIPQMPRCDPNKKGLKTMFLLGKQSKLPVNYLSRIYLPTLVPNRELKSERSGLSRLQTACDIYAAILLTNQERRGADGGRTLTARRGPGARCLVLPRALASVGGSGTRRQMMHRPTVHLPPPPAGPARRCGGDTGELGSTGRSPRGAPPTGAAAAAARGRWDAGSRCRAGETTAKQANKTGTTRVGREPDEDMAA